MHTIIKAVALYASISTLFWAAVFIAYLEIYSWVTKEILTEEELSWRVLIPRLSFYASMASGLVTVCATIADAAGF